MSRTSVGPDRAHRAVVEGREVKLLDVYGVRCNAVIRRPSHTARLTNVPFNSLMRLAMLRLLFGRRVRKRLTRE